MQLRVATYNVGLMRIHAWGCTLFENPAGVAARAPAACLRVREACRDADVVCLQECYEEAHRRMMRVSLDTHPFVAAPGDATWLNSGLMLFSKHPLLSAERVPHSARTEYERALGDRAFLVARVAVAGRAVTVVNVHLSSGVRVDSPEMARVRAAQIDDIEARAAAEAGAVIIAGDFNCSPDVTPENYHRMRRLGWRDAWEDAGAGPGYTWDADNPLNWAKRARNERSHRCDHVWLRGRGAAAASAAVIGAGGAAVSDHYGVLAELRLARA